MTDLHISDAIKQRACEIYDQDLARDEDDGSHYDEVSEFDLHAEVVALKAVAPAIVAAELRRIAAELIETYSPDTPQIHSAMATVRHRADELDGGES